MGPSQAAEQPSPEFVFATCQVGAEPALKAELHRAWPALHFAYSRGGFLTFKLPDDHPLPDDLDLKSVFARAHGFSLGKAAGGSLDEATAEVWRIAGRRSYDALHVWQRDAAAIGHRGFEPHVTPAALATEEAIRRHASADLATPPLARVAQIGARVLDCILVEPHEWWVGFHRATTPERCFPGGLRDIQPPDGAVSRAYLKMEESLAWSELPMFLE